MRVLIILLLFIALIFLYYSRQGAVSREIIVCTEAPAAIGPYSQAVKVGERVYVSGQIALDKNGKLDSSSVAAETEQCLRNIQAIVESAGFDLKAVSKCSVFLTDLNGFKEMNGVYSRYFPENAPARETIEVKALPKGAHVEISAIVN
jgi:2-iminobutanoate/2-iminopropanoate deaminase